MDASQKNSHQKPEQLAAVGRIARAINASLNLRDTLDAIATVAAELVPCMLVAIDLWDASQGLLCLQVIRATYDSPYQVGHCYVPGEGFTGWVVRNKRSLFIPDVTTRPDIQPRMFPGERQFQGYIGVPILVGENLIGILELVQEQANAFTQDDFVLMETLAGQAAIAIHNARIYEELARHHQEILALYTIAEAINQPLELQQMLESALKCILDLTGADGGGIRLIDWQAGQAVLAAHSGLSEAYVREAARFPLSREIVGQVARSGRATLSNDMWADRRVSRRVGRLLKDVGHRSLAQVALIAQDRVVGTLGISSRQPGFFSEEDLKLLSAIGQQLGVAVRNGQLYQEAHYRARQMAALNDVAAVVNQPLPLDEIMRHAVAKVVEVMKTDAGGIRLIDQATGRLVMVASQGLSEKYLQQVGSIPQGQGVVGRVAKRGIPEIVQNISTDATSYDREAAIEEGLATFAVVPIRARGIVVGTLGVVNRHCCEFSGDDIALLTAIGDAIGVAFENDRLRQETLQAERLAAVGRVATGVAHDLRSPLGGILRSAEFLARPEISLETRQKLSQSVISLSRRLILTSQGILDYVQGERLTLRLTEIDLAGFLDGLLEVLQVDFSDRGIEVSKRYLYRGVVVMDPDRMAQVIFNLAENARDAMPGGGRFTLTAQKTGDWVEMRFKDTGAGVPAHLVERIFEPFFSYGKHQGAGLGLAIARQIVQQHGGTIRLKTAEGKGSTFIINLPQ